MSGPAGRAASLELGVVGNSQIAALVDGAARIVWLCFPRLDSDPVFGALVDADRDDGAWSIEIVDAAGTEQRYLRNTAILETVVRDLRGGGVRIVDFCPRFKRHGRIFRPPVLVRRIEPLGGAPRIRIRIRPHGLRGEGAPSVSQGSHHIRFGWPGSAVRVTTDAPLAYILDETPFVLDRPCSFVFGSDEPLAEAPDQLAAGWLAETHAYWLEWVRYLSLPFEWQAPVMRAAITLKLCQFEDTGALVAALTTSIPEAPGSARNWDYRFCWLRDAFHVVYALNLLGATRTMEEFISFAADVAAAARAGELQPLYPIARTPPSPEVEIADARGYRRHRPVRFGNAAIDQVQNDVYGSVVVAAAQMFFDERLPAPGDGALYERLVPLGVRARAVALTPDAGIWEYRGRTGIHTHSAVMSWGALDRLSRIAARLGRSDEAAAWRRDADALRAAILSRAWDPRREAFVGTLDGGEMDGSVLVMPTVGFLPADDPRFLSTLDAIGRELDSGGFIARYAHADDFGRPETAFVVCSLWYAEALAAAGRIAQGRAVFERVLARTNRLGLLSEDIDPASGELWGNFPQTYCMAGLVSAAMRLSRGWKEGIWDASS
ncbi:MAG: glycoside hydrolase family 15 protein [Rhodospirillales bacterium]|nr:glycoside hydrolase family 15 protein [Rhodospirillales bacterium]